MGDKLTIYVGFKMGRNGPYPVEVDKDQNLMDSDQVLAVTVPASAVRALFETKEVEGEVQQ